MKWPASKNIPSFPVIASGRQVGMRGLASYGAFFPDQSKFSDEWYVETLSRDHSLCIPPGHAFVWHLTQRAYFRIDPSAKTLSVKAFKLAFKEAHRLFEEWRGRQNPQLLTIGNPRGMMAAWRARRAENPALLTITNPKKRAESSMEKARRAYRQFHGVDPGPAVTIGKGDHVLIALGELKEIVYKPTKGDRKGPAWYHLFGKGAILATDPDGKKLFIVDRKGKIRVDFDRGIIG